MRLIQAVCPTYGARREIDMDDGAVHVYHENGEQFGYDFEMERLRAAEDYERERL